MDTLLHALQTLGVPVLDLRGKLPTHQTKSFAARDASRILGLVAHHSAGPTGGQERFRQIADYHVGPNHISDSGCPGICYTMGITQYGEVCIFWDLDRATWSQGDKTQPGDENAQWLSCLLVGNFRSVDNPNGGEPTLEQMRSFLGLAAACRKTFGERFQFSGHFAFGKPACPGTTMEALVRALAANVETEKPISILQVQRALVFLGYLSTPQADGLDGPTTRGAVSRFQKAAGLTVDGKAGAKTWAELDFQVKARQGKA